MEQEKLRTVIAERIAFYRKALRLTQSELAEKINYSDKSVSKWERGDGVPDIYILTELAELFGVTVNDLVSDAAPRRNIGARLVRVRALITSISVGVVWLVASILFLALQVLPVSGRLWLVWLYAIPTSAIVLIVFSALWWNRFWQFLSIALLVWGIALCVAITCISIAGMWLVYVVAAVLQVLEIFWFFLRAGRSKA